MSSYQVTLTKAGAEDKGELFASHEFEAPDTISAKSVADAWFKSQKLIAPGPTYVRLYAGRALLCERTALGEWESRT